MIRSLRSLLVLTSALAACVDDGGARLPSSEFSMPVDVHSLSRPDAVRVTHLDLDLTADFDARVLTGSVTLDVERTDPTAPLTLDTQGIQVHGVSDGAGAPLRYTLETEDPVLGQPLVVELGEEAKRVVVAYSTRAEAEAVQWLEPRQTSGDHPFLFTQGQAILTRSWIPCQDTPAVRQTWSGRIVAPEALRVVMSAEQLTPDGEPADGGRAYRFRLDRAVPSYLIALAIGDLGFRAVGARSGVFAEPAVLDSAAAEFEDTERMIEAAEELYGPYLWGRFDILVLPPAFPFGGMENPCLTFATPTVIAGDKSLVALIAHELAHSWSGNLVTNAVWADLWLNEGFTVYFENRIMEVLYGEDDARMLRVLGWQDLQDDLDAFGATSPDTCLHLDLAGRNPDDAFSNVPYEKGALFLRTVEGIVGRPRLDAFLTDYFDRFAFQPMTSARFLDHLRGSLLTDDAEWAQLDAETWVHAPGLPTNADQPHSARFAAVDAARDALLENDALPSDAWAAWTTHERLHFLRRLDGSMPADQLVRLDEALGLTDSGNSELLFEWLRIGIRNHHEPTFSALRGFLVRQGRRKFLKPLYQDLVKTEWGKTLARTIYDEARPLYHAVSSRTIDQVLEGAGA